FTTWYPYISDSAKAERTSVSAAPFRSSREYPANLLPPRCYVRRRLDQLRFLRRPVRDPGLADDILPAQPGRGPHVGIVTVVAMISQHEVVVWRHLLWAERVVGCDELVWLLQDVAVDIHVVIGAHLDRLTRQTDDPLDEVTIGRVGRNGMEDD